MAGERLSRNCRRPLSVLVVVYARAGDILLLRRARPFDFWQSVTGSLDRDETHAQAAVRELAEETGLRPGPGAELAFTGTCRTFVIDPRWRHRYPPGVSGNTEYEWRCCVAEPRPIRLDEGEHIDYRWLPVAEAIERVWSPSNRDALISLAEAL